MENTFLLYGANGYTGELIARHSSELGLKPILAGRNESAVRALAKELNLEYSVFSLDDSSVLDAQLEKVPLVLHAAGPFIHTARPMMEACLRTKTHYLDITGEIQVFELGAYLGKKAVDAGIMIMPGVGFDVVPTDCTALYLKSRLPDATHLQLAFGNKGSRLSRGTALTMAENLGGPGAVRSKGKIIPVPLGHKSMKVPFTDAYHWLVMTIPWGDVSTSYYTTGIPNIETYTSVPPKTYKLLQWQRYFNVFLKMNWVRNMAKRRIKNDAPGPSVQQRRSGRSFIWGKVTNAAGETAEARLNVPEGYDLTMKASTLITKRVLEGELQVGYQTPAKVYGADFIFEVDDSVTREDL
jgi:short subunit dehydrogenase-like uncharacterized protein